MLARKTQEPAQVADGLLELPPGKIAAVATYLEMHDAPAARFPGLPGRLERIGRDLARYRRLYADVGQAWLWFSRTLVADEALDAVIGDPRVEALALVVEGRDAGIVELDFRRDRECELAFFGLVPALYGRGVGAALIGEAIRRAFSRPIRRLWLHTCTLDHPAAMPLYLRAGFRPYRRAVEIADDPRLSGRLPAAAAAHFPIVR